MEVTTNSASETKKLAAKLAKNIKAGDIICLYGQLGSGKTTFVQGLVEGLGVKDRVQSPTFIFIRFYGSNIKVAHIDLYRLESKEELESLGLEELFGKKDTISVIEWPELLGDVLPPKTIKIRFEYLSKNKRNVIVVEGESLYKDSPFNISYKLYLDTAKRDIKVIKLLKNSEVVDEITSAEDDFVLIRKILEDNNISINDISKIDINCGPGSFTGLKVGAAIANAFNYVRGNIKNWNDLILPEYGKEPNISKPKGVKSPLLRR